MSLLNRNTKSKTNHNLKRDNVLFPHTTYRGTTSAAAHVAEASNKSKQKKKMFCLNLKRLFTTSSTSTGAPQHQQQTSTTRESSSNFFASKMPFKSYSVGTKSCSRSISRFSHSNVSEPIKHIWHLNPPAHRKGNSASISSTPPGTEIGKDFSRLKWLPMFKPRQFRQKGFSAMTNRGLPSDNSDFGNFVLGTDTEDDGSSERSFELSNVQSLEHIAKRKAITYYDKDIPRFLNSVLSKKQQQRRRTISLCVTSATSPGLEYRRARRSTITESNIRVITKNSTYNYDNDVVDEARHLTVPTELEKVEVGKLPQCHCQKRRLKLIADSLNILVVKNKDKTLVNEKIRELRNIDSRTYHFKTCSLMAGCSRRMSEASLYSITSCILFHEPEEQLEEDVAEVILLLMEQLENDEELHIPMITINYFLHSTCYDHFMEGLIQVIGSECTPKNLARFYYLMRRIIINIGDPSDENNKTIENILNYSKKFYLQYYDPLIKRMYQTRTNFLLSGLEDNDVN